MTEKKWKETIKADCQAVGTYKEAFDPVIDSLASLLAQRDEVKAEYKRSKSGPTMEYVNKNGSKNLVKHPLLVLRNDFEKTALAYWNALGLTPVGLKKLNEDAMKPPKKNALSEAMKNLG